MMHYYLRVQFYGFILCLVIIVCMFMGILVYVACLCYSYFIMNLCFYRMYLYVYILFIMFCKIFVCIYFNCMQFEKFMWHSSVGCWVCYDMFHRENESVLLCIVA
jgi:hypothetical protein